MDIKVIASGSKGNCYRISDGNTSLLLDAGVPIKSIRIGCDFGLNNISACLVTHSHNDHCKAVKDLLKSGIAVYMPGDEIEAAGLNPHHRLYPLKKTGDKYGSFTAGSFNILPFGVQHDTPEPVGYLVCSLMTGERLLYFTDTFYLRYRFQRLTHIIGECNYDEDTLKERLDEGETPSAMAKRLYSSHMSLNTFLDFLRANDLSRLRQIYICHMSAAHGNEERIKEAVQRLTGVEVYVC